MSDEYRPRPDDELVEPIFGALRGSKADPAPTEPEAPERRGCLTAAALVPAALFTLWAFIRSS